MSYEKRETEFANLQELKNGLKNDADRVSLFRLSRKAETPQRFISSFLSKRGLDGKMAEYQFATHWRKIVGDGVANNAVPSKIINKVLYVNVKSASWMQELSFQKALLIKNINEYFNDPNKIVDIKFNVSNK